MTQDQSASRNSGLAHPLRIEHIGSQPDSQPEYSFGWCLIDANNRILAPYLNKFQADEMLAALTPVSERGDSISVPLEVFKEVLASLHSKGSDAPHRLIAAVEECWPLPND